LHDLSQNSWPDSQHQQLWIGGDNVDGRCLLDRQDDGLKWWLRASPCQLHLKLLACVDQHSAASSSYLE
jgi:hypothetical protein